MHLFRTSTKRANEKIMLQVVISSNTIFESIGDKPTPRYVRIPSGETPDQVEDLCARMEHFMNHNTSLRCSDIVSDRECSSCTVRPVVIQHPEAVQFDAARRDIEHSPGPGLTQNPFPGNDNGGERRDGSSQRAPHHDTGGNISSD